MQITNIVIRRLNETLRGSRSVEFVSCMGNEGSNDVSHDQSRWEAFVETFKPIDINQGDGQNDVALAQRALLAAVRVDSLWLGIRYFLAKPPSEFDHENLTKAILSQVESLTSAAAAVGYWLSKSEFAPHRADSERGKKTKEDRSRGGQSRRDQIIAKAEKWRGPALAFALKERSKPNSKFGQKALATAILKEAFWDKLEADDKKFKIPATDTIIATIKDWEDEGESCR